MVLDLSRLQIRNRRGLMLSGPLFNQGRWTKRINVNQVWNQLISEWDNFFRTTIFFLKDASKERRHADLYEDDLDFY